MRRRLITTITLALAALLVGSLPAAAQVANEADDEVRLRRQAVRERWRDATPAERRRVRRLALEHWAEMPAEERQQVREYRSENLERGASREALRRDMRESTTRAERREIRRYLEGLSPEERRALRARVENYRTLGTSDRQRLREALREFRTLPPEKQERFRANARRWKEMSSAEKARLREKMSLLREMEPEERLELLERTLPEDAAAVELPTGD